MLKKINKFIDKYFNWKLFKNLLLGELCMIPYSFFTGMYHIPVLYNIIMVLSVGISISFFTKAFLSVGRD